MVADGLEHMVGCGIDDADRIESNAAASICNSCNTWMHHECKVIWQTIRSAAERNMS
jgi:hypothetical protein